MKKNKTKTKVKNLFRLAFILLELAIVAFFLHNVAVNLLKVKDFVFLPAIFALIFASLIVVSYGLAKKLVDFIDKKLKK